MAKLSAGIDTGIRGCGDDTRSTLGIRRNGITAQGIANTNAAVCQSRKVPSIRLISHVLSSISFTHTSTAGQCQNSMI